MEILTPHRAMQRALSILGYPNPYHFSNILGNVKDCDMWVEAFDAIYSSKGTFGKEQWDQLLGHCGAVTDQPSSVSVRSEAIPR